MGEVLESRPRQRGPAWRARVIRVLAGAQLKVRYADSVLGYAWAVIKPLALFAILYVVFGRALRFGGEVDNYPVFLLIGIVLFMFFADATTGGMQSLAAQGQLLRRLAFPRVIVPLTTSATAVVGLLLNVAVLVVFFVATDEMPSLGWLLVPFLLVELYLFTLGLTLFLATVFLWLRDIGAVWELLLRVMFYGLAIIYPLQLLPEWGQRVVLFSPFAQVMQDIRALVLGGADVVTAGDVGGLAGYLVPLGITAAVFVLGLGVFKWAEPRLAELV
jgi:ABC-2 type transport system permease protein